MRTDGLSDETREDVYAALDKADKQRVEINGYCKTLGVDAHLESGMSIASYFLATETIILALLKRSLKSAAEAEEIRRLFPNPIEDAEREALLKRMSAMQDAVLGGCDFVDGWESPKATKQ